MSFLSSLFGKLAPAPAEKVAEPVEYKGFIIRATPFKSEGQYQTAGTIEREIGGVRKEHRFIRADAFASFDDAVTHAEQGAADGRSAGRADVRLIAGEASFKPLQFRRRRRFRA